MGSAVVRLDVRVAGFGAVKAGRGARTMSGMASMTNNVAGQRVRSLDIGERTGRTPRAPRAVMSGLRSMAVPCIAAVLALGWAVPPMTWGASAKTVFANVARSVVVVLAMDRGGAETGQGSGVVVDKQVVVTNCHVVEEAAEVAVRQAVDSAGGETYRMAASLLARDDERDLCLLLVNELSESPAAPSVHMGTAKSLEVGEEVYAVGAPQGLALSLSRGIVSQLRGAFGKRQAPLVQTDAAISPGSSGGGLFNGNGELVGVTTFKWKGENLNFALPVEWVGQLLAQSRVKVAAERKAAEKRAACLVHPSSSCVLALAMETARDIEAGLDRTQVLRAIAEARVEPGDIAATLETAHGLDEGFSRARDLNTIAETRAKPGDITVALEFALGIDNIENRVEALLVIAEAQAEMGDKLGTRKTFAMALEATRGMEDFFYRSMVFRDIGKAQVKAGDLAAALEVARGPLRWDKVMAEVLRDVAEAQAKAGDIAIALETAHSIHEGYRRLDAFHAIANAQVDAGDKQGAGKTYVVALDALNIAVLDDVLFAMIDIAMSQTKVGDKEGARKTVADVLASLEYFQVDGGLRASILRAIAEAQAATGDVENAMKVAMEIEPSHIRANALVDIATQLAVRQ